MQHIDQELKTDRSLVSKAAGDREDRQVASIESSRKNPKTDGSLASTASTKGNRDMSRKQKTDWLIKDDVNEIIMQ